MIANDLQNRAPSIWASEDISGLVAANGAAATLAAHTFKAMVEAATACLISQHILME